MKIDGVLSEVEVLPRPNRLANGREIARVYQKGRSSRSDLFRMAWLPTRRPAARVAIVTSRKLSTKAVRRNLAKRRVRAIVAQFLPSLGSIDLIIQILPKAIGQATAKKRDQARQAVGELGYGALRSDLLEMLTRQGLLRSLEGKVESRK